MSTTLLNAEIALSKEIGDYWASTSTSAGAAGGTTIVDTALKAKANDWITDEAYDMITSGTYDEQERKISSLDNSTGTLTVLAHGGQIASSVTYRVHRLFSADEKKRALLFAARSIWPALYDEVWNESMVSGNWLKDGSFERWTTSSNLTDWTETTVTAARTTTAGYVKHGTNSCKLDTAAGTLSTNISSFSALQYLRGRNVTFTCQGWCDTASCLRLSINDGTTQTYSSYHDGDSAWTEDNPRNDSFYVTQYITPNATQVTFTIHHESAAGTSYVDDARAISDTQCWLYIGHIGLAQNRPTQVLMEQNYYDFDEPWIPVRDYIVDDNGYLYIPSTYMRDRRLRILGKKYLDFVDTSGDASTGWDATIDIDEPELKILTAEAALHLYQVMSMPNYETGTRKDFQEMVNFWKNEVAERKNKWGMYSRAGAHAHWGVH